MWDKIMKRKKAYLSRFLVLSLCLFFLPSYNCLDGETDKNEDGNTILKITIINNSLTTMKYLYYDSELCSGVIKIDVPGYSEKSIIAEALPGENFNIKITASDPAQYIQWEKIPLDPGNSSMGTSYLTLLKTTIEPDKTCMLLYMTLDIFTGVNSTENTILP